MKKLLIIFLSILCFGCSNDDRVAEKEKVAIHGKWNLIRVSGGLLGTDARFEKGQITWDFDEAAMKVQISISAVVQDEYNGIPSRIYPYSITAPADADILIVNNDSYGSIMYSDTKLILGQEQVLADGLMYEFIR